MTFSHHTLPSTSSSSPSISSVASIPHQQNSTIVSSEIPTMSSSKNTISPLNGPWDPSSLNPTFPRGSTTLSASPSLSISPRIPTEAPGGVQIFDDIMTLKRTDDLPVKPIRFSFKNPKTIAPSKPIEKDTDFISFADLDIESPTEKTFSHGKRKRNPFAEEEEERRGEPPTKWRRREVKSKDILSSLPDPPWKPEGRVYSTNLTAMLHQEIVDYANHIAPRKEEHEMRRLAMDRIATVARKIWPNCKVDVFGSFDTQIYLPSSDIDMLIIDSAARPPNCLYNLADLLRREGVCSKVETIAKARVPIIKVVDAITQYPIDISFNLMSGVDSAEIVKELLKDPHVGPAVKPLLLVLKQFLVQRGQNEVYTGGLGSYGLLMLLMNFLKLHPLLQSGEMLPQANLGVLLLEFFELYGKNFNFDDVGIGLNRKNGAYYFDKSANGWDSRPGSLTVQDPQDPDNDITRGSFAFYGIRQEFNRAFVLLTTMINAHRVRVLRGENPPVLNTLLSSIVRVKKVTEEHRDFITKTWREIQSGQIDAAIPQSPVLKAQPKQGHILFVEDESSDDAEDVSKINVVNTNNQTQEPPLDSLIRMYGDAADILTDEYEIVNGLPMIVDRVGRGNSKVASPARSVEKDVTHDLVQEIQLSKSPNLPNIPRFDLPKKPQFGQNSPIVGKKSPNLAVKNSPHTSANNSPNLPKKPDMRQPEQKVIVKESEKNPNTKNLPKKPQPVQKVTPKKPTPTKNAIVKDKVPKESQNPPKKPQKKSQKLPKAPNRKKKGKRGRSTSKKQKANVGKS